MGRVTSEPVRGAGWPMFGGDARHTGRSQVKGPRGKIRWRFRLPINSLGSPAVGEDGTVYVGSAKGIVYAINGETGRRRWSQELGLCQGRPAVASRDVVVFAGDRPDDEQDDMVDEHNIAYGLDAHSGKVLWSAAIRGSRATYPTIGSRGDVLLVGDTGQCYCLDAGTGHIRWEKKISRYENEERPPACDGKGKVYSGNSSGEVVCLDEETGASIWNTSGKPGGGFVTRCAIDDEGRLFAGGAESRSPAPGSVSGTTCNYMVCVDTRDGRLLWKTEVEGSIRSGPSVALNGEVLYGTDDGHLYALKPTDGAVSWSFRAGDNSGRASEGVNILAQAIDREGTIYFGAYNWRLYALNPDGKLKWVRRMKGVVPESVALGGRGRLYVIEWQLLIPPFWWRSRLCCIE